MSSTESNATLLRAANEACQTGRPLEIQSLLDRFEYVTPEYIKFFGSSDSLEKRTCQQQLETAAEHNYSPLVKHLLENCHCAEVTRAVVRSAHDGGSVDVFQQFLDHGWDINGDTEQTSLNCAVSHNNITLVNWHLSHGADPRIHTGAGGDPLTRAAVTSKLAIVHAIVEHGGIDLNDTEALIAAAANVDMSEEPIKIMRYLLDAGVAIDRVETPKVEDLVFESPFTGTALHRAVEVEVKERVELLLERGANPSIKGVRGMTPLEAAKIRGMSEMVDILRGSGKA